MVRTFFAFFWDLYGLKTHGIRLKRHILVQITVYTAVYTSQLILTWLWGRPMRSKALRSKERAIAVVALDLLTQL